MSTVYLIIICVMIALEGFFSGTEIAIVSLNRIRLRILAEGKNRSAIRIQKMLNNPNRFLGTTLVGTNISVVVAASFCAKLIYDTYGVKSEWLTTLVLAPFILIFGEFIPKAVFAQRADRITFYLGYILKFFWGAFYPIVWLINNITNAILTLLLGHEVVTNRSPFVTREELRYLIKESETTGEIDPYEKNLIYKIFDFGKKKVKDVMKNLKELVFALETDRIEDLVVKASESGYSRFPVCSASGEFLGIVNILDIIYEEDRTKPLKEFLRPMEYVDVHMDIDSALFILQTKKQHLAIVKNSANTPVGFFTMQDLLAELIG